VLHYIVMMRVTMGFYLILEWGKVVVVLVVIFDDVKVVKFGRRSFGRMNRRALEKKAVEGTLPFISHWEVTSKKSHSIRMELKSVFSLIGVLKSSCCIDFISYLTRSGIDLFYSLPSSDLHFLDTLNHSLSLLDSHLYSRSWSLSLRSLMLLHTKRRKKF